MYGKMFGRKRKIKFVILLFLFSRFLFQALWGNVTAKTVFDEPEDQLPSINNLGAPSYWYNDFLVRDSLAYCNCLNYELVIFDFSNPKEPILVDVIQFANLDYIDSGKMFFHGENLCFVNTSMLAFFDISQPTNPIVNDSVAIDLKIKDIYNIKIDSDIGLLVGNSAYYTGTETIRNGHLTILNFTNTVDPIIGEYLNNKFVRDVSLEENYAFLMDGNYHNELNGFEIIDISNSSNPFKVSEWQGVCMPTSIEVVNNYLLLTTYENGLMVIDVSDPANPQKINEYNRFPNMRDIFCVGNLAYIVYDRGIVILDLTNPESISKVGKKRIFFEGNGEFTEVIIEDNFAYALRYSEFEGREIFVFDVSNPSYPKKLFPLGIKIGHETVFFTIAMLLWVGIPVVVISAIIVPIVVVRKKRKKRRQELREHIKDIQHKSTLHEEPIEGAANN